MLEHRTGAVTGTREDTVSGGPGLWPGAGVGELKTICTQESNPTMPRNRILLLQYAKTLCVNEGIKQYGKKYV